MTSDTEVDCTLLNGIVLVDNAGEGVMEIVCSPEGSRSVVFGTSYQTI